MPSSADCAVLQAYGEGVAARRAEFETKWGVGRGELLAGDDLRAKFRGQCARWAEAYRVAWEAPFLTGNLLAEVQRLAAAMGRGYAALDAAAEEAGHRPIAPWVWECLLPDGSIAAFVQSEAEAAKVIADGRYLAVYTLTEMANVLAALPDVLRLAKAVFPGATFQPPNPFGKRPDWLKRGGDAIPFGDPARELVGDPTSAEEWR